MSTQTGIQMIAEERQRQIEEEGWSAEHDDNHKGGELRVAAAFYALAQTTEYHRLISSTQDFEETWPWDPKWWKPGKRGTAGVIANLKKAGALIAAEIDRLQRLEE